MPNKKYWYAVGNELKEVDLYEFIEHLQYQITRISLEIDNLDDAEIADMYRLVEKRMHLYGLIKLYRL
jgi:hypothetical protein